MNKNYGWVPKCYLRTHAVKFLNIFPLLTACLYVVSCIAFQSSLNFKSYLQWSWGRLLFKNMYTQRPLESAGLIILLFGFSLERKINSYKKRSPLTELTFSKDFILTVFMKTSKINFIWVYLSNHFKAITFFKKMQKGKSN